MEDEGRQAVEERREVEGERAALGEGAVLRGEAQQQAVEPAEDICARLMGGLEGREEGEEGVL